MDLLVIQVFRQLSADKQTLDLDSPDGCDILMMISICQWQPQLQFLKL